MKRHLPVSILVLSVIVLSLLFVGLVISLILYFNSPMDVSGTSGIILVFIVVGILGFLYSAMLLRQKWAAYIVIALHVINIVLLIIVIFSNDIAILFINIPSILINILIIKNIASSLNQLGLPESSHCKFPYNTQIYEKCPSCSKTG